jgi:hypothetical protein
MYRVTAEEPAELAGAQPLCSMLMASGTTPFVYSGPLLGIATDATTTPGRWSLDVSLPEADGIFSDAECTVHFVYRAWHKDSPEGTGYTDEKFDSFTFVFDAPEPESQPAGEIAKPLEESPLDTTDAGDDTSGDEPPVADETLPELVGETENTESEGANEEEDIEQEPATTEPAATETPPAPPVEGTPPTPVESAEPAEIPQS